MQMILYKTSSQRNMVHKALSIVKTITFRAKKPKNILNPVFEISGAISDTDFNYCYIADLERYYYVENVETLVKGGIRLYLSEDLLMSHWDKIKNLDAIIARQEHDVDFYLNDGDIPVKVPTRVQTKLFPNGFSNTSRFYMTILGADASGGD